MKWAAFLLAALVTTAFAEVQDTPVSYKQGNTTLAGTFAVDSTSKAPRPGIVIFHQWAGPTEHEHQFADRLAKLGYAAFVADIYGEGVRPTTTEEKMEQVTKYKTDRELMRARAQAALDALRGQPGVDPKHLAALGFCFGGTVALELARSGAPIDGVISFHGGLDTPHPADAKQIKGHVLALHGANDPFVKPSEVEAFEQEMKDAGVDWELVKYGGAVHAFTQKEAGDDPSKGLAYNELAAKRSWQALTDFLKEIFP